jgi:hypothetical protein
MVLPDLALICEIMLMAEGFQNSKLLSRKFIILYKLCEVGFLANGGVKAPCMCGGWAAAQSRCTAKPPPGSCPALVARKA